MSLNVTEKLSVDPSDETESKLRWWGRGPESYSAVLVQHIGERSALVTFEHRDDPAFRTTLVVDERDRIARQRLELGERTCSARGGPIRTRCCRRRGSNR